MRAEDAVLAMPPEPTWFAGRDAIAAFLAAIPLAATTPRHRLVPTRANGSLRATEIMQITFFRSTDAFTGFDLPEHIAT